MGHWRWLGLVSYNAPCVVDAIHTISHLDLDGAVPLGDVLDTPHNLGHTASFFRDWGSL